MLPKIGHGSENVYCHFSIYVHTLSTRELSMSLLEALFDLLCYTHYQVYLSTFVTFVNGELARATLKRKKIIYVENNINKKSSC